MKEITALPDNAPHVRAFHAIVKKKLPVCVVKSYKEFF